VRLVNVSDHDFRLKQQPRLYVVGTRVGLRCKYSHLDQPQQKAQRRAILKECCYLLQSRPDTIADYQEEEIAKA
jgi:hypothetical protein